MVREASKSLGVAQGVAEIGLGDSRQGVSWLDDVHVRRTIRRWLVGFVGDLQHGAGDDEVGSPVEERLVQLDDLWEPGAVAEQPFGDLPQAVATLDRVVDGRRVVGRGLDQDGRSAGEGGRSLNHRGTRSLVGDGRSSRCRVGGWGREGAEDGRGGHEQQRRDGDELTGRPLRPTEAGKRGSRQPANL